VSQSGNLANLLSSAKSSAIASIQPVLGAIGKQFQQIVTYTISPGNTIDLEGLGYTLEKVTDFFTLVGIAQTMGQQIGTDIDNPNLTALQKTLRATQAGGDSAIIPLILTGVAETLGSEIAIPLSVLLTPNVAESN
jgi:hypothetical protein